MPNNQQQRAQQKLRRLLLLIDCMSQLDQPKTVGELAAEFCADVSLRSIRRDLDLLVSMKLAFVEEVTYQGPHGERRYTYVYSINRERTRSLIGFSRKAAV